MKPSPARVARRFVAVAKPTGLALMTLGIGDQVQFILYDPIGAYNALVDPINEAYADQQGQLDRMEPELREIYSVSGIRTMALHPRYGVMPDHIYAFLDSTDKCDGASVVRAVRARRGYGPLIYDIAMGEMGSLIPHRSDVSAAAKRVWRYYDRNRPDVLKRPAEDCPKWTGRDSKILNQVYSLKRPKATGRLSNASRTFERDLKKLLKEFNVEWPNLTKSVYQLVSQAGEEFYRDWERYQ